MKRTPEERRKLTQTRIIRILRKHKIALLRTLEQKISDAGPNNQRIDPHILNAAMKQLINKGIVNKVQEKNSPTWFHLSSTPVDSFSAEYIQQKKIHDQIAERDFKMRIGQALEIAVFKALNTQSKLDFFGGYPELEMLDDSVVYKKHEPPSMINGRSLPGETKLDYIIMDKQGNVGGVEIKNLREWLYPTSPLIKAMLQKCVAIDAIPILIARRIPYITFQLMYNIGGIVHQNYNQLFPASGIVLATAAKNKHLLGYHDIRIGNEPDKRMLKFIQVNLPNVLADARNRFDVHKSIIKAYVDDHIDYDDFKDNVLHEDDHDEEMDQIDQAEVIDSDDY